LRAHVLAGVRARVRNAPTRRDAPVIFTPLSSRAWPLSKKCASCSGISCSCMASSHLSTTTPAHVRAVTFCTGTNYRAPQLRTSAARCSRAHHPSRGGWPCRGGNSPRAASWASRSMSAPLPAAAPSPATFLPAAPQQVRRRRRQRWSRHTHTHTHTHPQASRLPSLPCIPCVLPSDPRYLSGAQLLAECTGGGRSREHRGCRHKPARRGRKHASRRLPSPVRRHDEQPLASVRRSS